MEDVKIHYTYISDVCADFEAEITLGDPKSTITINN